MFPKRYGSYRVEQCPFCGRQATALNAQGVAVCRHHRDRNLDLRCACGSWLEVRTGKHGAFCVCPTCGAVSLRKALEMQPPEKQPHEDPGKSTESRAADQRTETTVRSDDPDYF